MAKTDTLRARGEALARGSREDRAKAYVVEEMIAQDVVGVDAGVLAVAILLDGRMHKYMVEVKVFEVDE